MALTPRKIYDATGVAYHVGVEPNSNGDIQAFCLYSADGNPITPLSSGDSIEVVPGDNFVEGIAEGTAIGTNLGVIAFGNDGSGNTQALKQGLTAAELATAALATEATLAKLNGFTIPVFDYIALGYTGDNLTSVVYKTGGSSGTTVRTLTLAYTGDQLDSVTAS